jgi:hypothetical protein
MDDELLRDVLNVIPDDDRGKLISLCLECIQNNERMNFREGVIFFCVGLTKCESGKFSNNNQIYDDG